MGKNIKKNNKKAHMVRLCPNCGNPIPYNSAHKVYRCKYCREEIQPEDNHIKEDWKDED